MPRPVDPAELYDLHEDPREVRNLVHDAAHRLVRERFLEEAFAELGFDAAKLDAYRRTVGGGGVPRHLCA